MVYLYAPFAHLAGDLLCLRPVKRGTECSGGNARQYGLQDVEAGLAERLTGGPFSRTPRSRPTSIEGRAEIGLSARGGRRNSLVRGAEASAQRNGCDHAASALNVAEGARQIIGRREVRPCGLLRIACGQGTSRTAGRRLRLRGLRLAGHRHDAAPLLINQQNAPESDAPPVTTIFTLARDCVPAAAARLGEDRARSKLHAHRDGNLHSR